MTLTVAVATTYPALPFDVELLSTVYEFGPSGTTFLMPVTVSFPLPPGAENPTVFWGNGLGGFDDLGGVIVGNTIQAQASHLTPAGVGHWMGSFAALFWDDGDWDSMTWQ
jgi:hypothetical protein